jgi:hypothetical protein
MARHFAVLLTTALVCGACSGTNTGGQGGGGGGMKDPPQVFLTAAEATVIASSLKVRANVSGCDKIKGIEIYNDKKFLIAINAPAKVPIDIDMPASVFSQLYNTLGIAVKLNLRARGICEDGRENRSTGLGISFFPVENVVGPQDGNASALPDAFIAEGGVGSTPTTFIGCVGTQTGTALARFGTDGKVANANLTLPFPCTYNSVISEKNAATGIRWLIEPGVGVFAFNSKPDSALNITAYQQAVIPNMGIGPDGDALVWNSKAVAANNFFRVNHCADASRPCAGGANGAPVWSTQVQGIMAGTPVVSQDIVRVIMWRGMIGQFFGTMVVMRFNYSTGSFISESALATIEYGEFNDPIIPAAAFNASGTLVYFSYQNAGAQKVTSQVIACASDSSTGCITGPRSWTSPLLDAVVVAAVPFSSGSLIAAVAGKKTFFLNATTGQIVNNFNFPIKPEGSLVTMGAQPGNGADFYLLNGSSNYPTEVIAVDSPQNGELWRVQIEGGQTPLNAMNIAIDEGNNAWLRVGTNLVKPSTLATYRGQKGSNLEPPDGGE